MTDGKTCSKCKVFKSFGEFSKDKQKKDGFQYNCKSCKGFRDREWYAANTDKLKLQMMEWYAANADKRKLQMMEYYKKNKVKQIQYEKTRRQTDEAFNLLGKLRCRLRQALNGNRKSASTKELTGMESSEDILKYLYEKSPRFEGVPLSELHVDHIIPCAAFDMMNVDHQRVCFHYTNLQLLTPAEKQSKNDSVPPGFDVDDYVKKHLPRGNSSFFSSAILPLP